jgi:Family of unknown function (DUF5675)
MDAPCRLELKTVAVRDDGCFSVLLWDGRPFAVSVERTFDDGRPVIPAGVHRCTRSFFEHGQYPTFEITVEGHTRVLFHKGNREIDSKACVVVAESFGILHGVTAVLNSAGGFAEFMELTRGLPEFNMIVTGR